MTNFYFLALAFCWGSAFLATKNIVSQIDPYYGAFSRVFFGFIFFIILFLARRKSIKVPVKEMWRPWLISFLLITFPFILMFWGQQHIPSGVAGIFNATVPFWVFVIAGVILKGEDSFNLTRGLGVLIGIAGILMIMLPKAQFSGNLNEFYGCLALLFMSVSYAAGNVATKYLMVDHNTISIEGNIFHQYLSAGVVILIIALIFGNAPSVQTLTQPKVLGSMVYVGVFSSAIAFLLLLTLIKRLGATRASAATYVVPLISLCLDFIDTGRIPALIEIGGTALIIFSLVLIQKPVKAKN
ncbi:drug/metabolite transporter (DMT)-like permease [Elusimicrobium posterum]|uniref:DMT family transporter n=1 Tax=Elusimicrobium posterum TaxID=3116653 RepID=UPI003C73352C